VRLLLPGTVNTPCAKLHALLLTPPLLLFPTFALRAGSRHCADAAAQCCEHLVCNSRCLVSLFASVPLPAASVLCEWLCIITGSCHCADVAAWCGEHLPGC
jgi:hypothetical protein